MIKLLRQRVKILVFFFFSFFLVLFSWQYFFSPTLVVTKIVDGDTIKLADGRVIRYISIDAPEKDNCFAQEAKKINQALVLGKKVRLEMDVNQMDRFGRYLAYVFTLDEKEVFVNDYLLAAGVGEFFLDTVNLKHQEALVQTAEKAHQENKGLWQACGPCQIKGNLDRMDKRWYHLPSFRHYEATEVNLEHGDRWFCTEEAALSAGFEKARE
ncbi:MAG TPA: thermonuclease family protein [Candidatus Bathyarchaeia archaeon]|nr:thermonuclease family protein [Candidatus Bathyarchaeia archaeon]